MKDLMNQIEDVKGGILAPVVMWWLGVPAVVCVLAWLFFFRG